MIKISECFPEKNLPLFYVGPDLKEGPLPACFYFSLSAEESLSLQPFNEPVVALSSLPIRIFSIDLPDHGPGLDPTKALSHWAEKIHAGENFVADFVSKVAKVLLFIEKQGALLPGRLTVSGLSRGAFLATHVAAQLPQFQAILGYAPLTSLSYTKEFEPLKTNPLVSSLDLLHQASKLTRRSLRFYIGNHDLRVSTSLCFHFIETLAAKAFEERIRSPNVELIIGPSIGHLGHGTSPAVFRSGAEWIASLCI